MLKLIRLEERIVLDGAMLDTATDVAAETGALDFIADAVDAIHEAFQQVAPVAAESARSEESLDVILISSDLPDIQHLVAAAQPGAYIHVFDAAQSSDAVLAKVNQFAGERGLPISNLAIVTHGDQGAIHFGNTSITSQSLVDQPQAWQALGQNMTANATLQVYGCEVAGNEAGQQLAQNLAALTGAEVQASDDLTGQGGDWDLEIATADVSAVNEMLQADLLAGYSASLDSPTIVTNEGATADEGGMVLITNDLLASTDPDDDPDQISYTITTAPEHGDVTLNGRGLQVGQFFTQADIDNGRVAYVNNGDEDTADSFSFEVSDPGVGQNQETGTFQLTINPINDTPELDLDRQQADRGYIDAFDEGGGPVPVVSQDTTLDADGNPNGVDITDLDSNIGEVTITLRNVFDADNETLAVDPNSLPNNTFQVSQTEGTRTDNNGNTIQTLTLTITGVATPEQYEEILRNVTYENTSDSEATPTRQIDIVVTDEQGASSLTSRTLLFSQNSPPVITPPPDFTIDEDNPTAVVFSVSDPDAADDTIRAELTLQNNDPNAELGTITIANQDNFPGVNFIDGDGTDGTLVLEGSQADINAALEELMYTPPQDFNGTASITLFVDDLANNGDTANDANVLPGDQTGGANGQGDRLTDEATVNITINAVNDAPVLTVDVPDDFAAQEDTEIKIPGLSVMDVDADPGELEVTLSVEFGTITLEDTSNINIIAGANGSSTVTFTGTQANINAALMGVCYLGDPNANDFNSGSLEILTFRVDDQGNSGGPDDNQVVTETLEFSVNPINDAPTVAVPAAQTTDEDTSINFTGPLAITVADVDANEDPNATSRDVRITLDVANGSLELGSTAGLNFAGPGGDMDGTDGTLVFEGTLDEVNAALDTLVYTPDENYNGADRLNVRIDDLGNFGDNPNDPNGAFGEPDADNLFAVDGVDITVDPVNDAPDVDPDPDNPNGFEGTFREDDGPVPIVADDLTLSDPDGDDITSIVITIDNLQDAPAEILAVDPTVAANAGVTAVYDPNNGTLTLTGPASAEDFRDVLVTATYDNSDQDPVAGDRDIVIEVSDGTDTTTVNSTITVVPVNDAPDITEPNNPQVNDEIFIEEETRTALTGVQISDVDARDEDVTVTLTVQQGVLDVPDDDPTNVTVAGNNTAQVTLTGSVDDVNAQLAALGYTPNDDFIGADTLVLNVNDLGNTGEGGALEDTEMVDLRIGPVNDAPVVTVPPAQTVAEDEPVVITGTSVADVDANGEDITVTLSVNNGTVTIDDDPNITIDGNGTDTITVTGTVDEINAVIDNITYQGDEDFNGQDVLTVTADDLGNTGAGGPMQDSETVGITVTPVEDEPEVDPNGPDIDGNFENTFTENQGPVSAVDADNLVIADADGDNLQMAVIQIDNVQDAGLEELQVDEALAATFGLTVVENGDTITITGNASPDDYAAVIATLTYNNTSENPDDTDRNISIVVTDETGTDSDPSLSVINVVPVNDAPVVTAPAQIDAAEETAQPVPGVSVSDIDAGDADVQVTLTAPNGALSVPATLGVAVDINADGDVTLTGSIDDINTALAGLNYTGDEDFSGTDTITVTINDQGNTGGGDLTDTATIQVNVADVNDPPVLNNNGATYPDGGSIVIGPDDLAAVDPDDDPSEVVFTLTDLPDHGQLTLNGVPLAVGDTFTQEDINNGLLGYTSNGDPAQSDSFDFNVADPDGEGFVGQTFTLTETSNGIPDPIDPFDPTEPFDPVLPGDPDPGPTEPTGPGTGVGVPPSPTVPGGFDGPDVVGVEVPTGALPNNPVGETTIGTGIGAENGSGAGLPGLEQLGLGIPNLDNLNLNQPPNGPFDAAAPGGLQPLVPDSDLFNTSVNNLEGMAAGLENGLLQGEYTDMVSGQTLLGTAGALGAGNFSGMGFGGEEIVNACSLMAVLDQGCRFNDAFNDPESHLSMAQGHGHEVGNYINPGPAGITPDGAIVALGLATDVFNNCGDANQVPGNFARSYLFGETGGEGECDANGQSAAVVVPAVSTSVAAMMPAPAEPAPVATNAEEVFVSETAAYNGEVTEVVVEERFISEYDSSNANSTFNQTTTPAQPNAPINSGQPVDVEVLDSIPLGAANGSFDGGVVNGGAIDVDQSATISAASDDQVDFTVLDNIPAPDQVSALSNPYNDVDKNS